MKLTWTSLSLYNSAAAWRRRGGVGKRTQNNVAWRGDARRHSLCRAGSGNAAWRTIAILPTGVFTTPTARQQFFLNISGGFSHISAGMVVGGRKGDDVWADARAVAATLRSGGSVAPRHARYARLKANNNLRLPPLPSTLPVCFYAYTFLPLF